MAAAAGQPNLGMGNAHGLQVVDIEPGRRINIDPAALGVRGHVDLQRLGFNAWTITRAPVQQPNGTYQVPVHKTDAQGNRVYIDNIPFADILAVVGGRRRRRATRSRRIRRRITRRTRV